MKNTQLNKSSPDLYELIFPLLPGQTIFRRSKEFSLNIFGSILPGLTIDTLEENYQGGYHPFQSGKIRFNEWAIDFIVDSDFTNWKILYSWLTYINNNKDHYSNSNYMVDATLKIMAPYKREILNVTFKNVFIVSLGDVTLDMRSGESVMECNTTLMYTRYEIKNLVSEEE